MTVNDAAWERIRANPTAPRASFLSMLDWKDKWIDGEKFPFTPSVSDLHGVEAACDVLLEIGLEASIAQHERAGAACRAGVRAMGLEPWPRSEAITRRVRDRDRRSRRAHRRAGSRALPRALRRDDLRRPGGRQPRPDRPHGARPPGRSTRSQGSPRSGRPSPISAPPVDVGAGLQAAMAELAEATAPAIGP